MVGKRQEIGSHETGIPVELRSFSVDSHDDYHVRPADWYDIQNMILTSLFFGDTMTIKSMMAVAAAKATKAAISALTSRPGGSTPGAVAMRIDGDVLSPEGYADRCA